MAPSETPKYPHQDGDVTVLGPEIFASSDGQVISWKGENFTRQTPPERTEEQLLYRRLALAHRARRAKEHQLDGIRRALCDVGIIQDDDPYGHADLEDVIRQQWFDQGEPEHPAPKRTTPLPVDPPPWWNRHEKPTRDRASGPDGDWHDALLDLLACASPLTEAQARIWLRQATEEIRRTPEEAMVPLGGALDSIDDALTRWIPEDRVRRYMGRFIEETRREAAGDRPCKCGHPKNRHRLDPILCLDCWRTGTTGTGTRLVGDTREHEHQYKPQEQLDA